MRMREPPQLDTEVRGIIDAARGADEPNELACARVRKGVDVKLAAGIALAVGPASSAFAGALKVTAAAVALGSAVTAGVFAIPRVLPKSAPAHAPATHLAARSETAVAARPAEVPLGETVVAPLPRPHGRHRAAARPATAPPPVETSALDASGLKDETALLGAANAALARGDVVRALALLDEYDHRPGPGLLAEERMVTGILASCAAGRVEAARVAAQRFQGRWPRSPLAARVEGSCVTAGRPGRPTF